MHHAKALFGTMFGADVYTTIFVSILFILLHPYDNIKQSDAYFTHLDDVCERPVLQLLREDAKTGLETIKQASKKVSHGFLHTSVMMFNSDSSLMHWFCKTRSAKIHISEKESLRQSKVPLLLDTAAIIEDEFEEVINDIVATWAHKWWCCNSIVRPRVVRKLVPVLWVLVVPQFTNDCFKLCQILRVEITSLFSI